MTKTLNNKSTQKTKITGWLIAWIVVWLANWAIYGTRQHTGLPLYLDASQHYVEGAKLYRTTGVDTDFDPYAYPPAMALTAVPILPFSETVQKFLWAGFNAGLLVFSIALVNSIIRNSLVQRASQRREHVGKLFAVFWIIVGAVVIRHILSPLENQSQDVIILALVTWGTWAATRRKDLSMGIGWGTAAALKLTPLLFLALLVPQGRIKGFIAMLAAFIIVSIAPDLIIPRGEGGPRIVSFYESFGGAIRPGQSGGAHWSQWNQLNQNLAGTLYRLSEPPPDQLKDRYPNFPLIPMSESLRQVLTYALQGCILLAVLVAGWWTRGPPRTERAPIQFLAAAGVTVCAMLLLSPMSSKSHFVVLLLPAAAIAVHWVMHPMNLICIAILLASFATGTLTSKGILGKDLGEIILAIGPVTLSALLLGVGSLYVTWSQTRKMPATNTD